MNRARLLNVAALIVLAAILFSALGCLNTGSSGGSAQPTAEVTKPKPSVESVDASTSGMLDKYYAILDITIKNDGADGEVIVVGTITQGSQTIENDLPVYITRNSKQVVRLVFPLKWKGGDWVPKVEVQIP